MEMDVIVCRELLLSLQDICENPEKNLFSRPEFSGDLRLRAIFRSRRVNTEPE